MSDKPEALELLAVIDKGLTFAEKEIASLRAECERLRAVLSESADFWAHYSSLNESEQDELNPQRHEMLAAMRNAIYGV